MTPTEWEGTVAVDAAARVAYDQVDGAAAGAPSFDLLEPLQQNAYREAVLPVVWAALEALNRPQATTVTEWGHPGGGGGVRYSLAQWEKFRTSYPEREHLTAHVRQRTSYADHVTDWTPQDGGVS